MAARTLLAVLALTSVAFTGCIAGDEPQEEGPLVNTSGAGPTMEMPDGREGKIVAFEETNMTEAGVGGVDHHHDNWGSQTRMVLFESEQSMNAFPDGQNRAYTTFNVPYPSPGATGIVFEGTGQVEVTISEPSRRACEGAFTLGGHPICTDYLPVLEDGTPVPPDPTGGPTGLFLRYRHGSASDFIDAGPLTWGAPTAIKITDPRQTDMPHSTTSLWQFQVISPNAYDTTLSFKVKAEIVRSDEADIPLWPGHPLFYTPEKRVREIYTGSHTGAGTGVSSTEETEIIQPDRLISYGTKSVYVWANITSVSAPNPLTAPITWYLWHTNASGITNITNPFDEVTHSASVKNHFWILPVKDNDMDSPYQDGSRWQFELRGAMTTPDPANTNRQVSCYGGCADYVVKYDIVVKASDIEEPMAEVYCEDQRIC